MKPNGQPATKRDLAELEARLDAKIDALAAETREGLKETREGLKETRASLKASTESLQEMIRDIQTEILKAFLPHQEAQNVRLRLLMSTDSALHQRIEIVELRLIEIEKRLLLNPPSFPNPPKG